MLFSFVIKLLPFDNLYSLGIAMLISLDPSILLFQILTFKNSAGYLNISIYMSMTFLSSEILSCSVVESLPFGKFYSLGFGMLNGNNGGGSPEKTKFAGAEAKSVD
jgi:hypothetical protein